MWEQGFQIIAIADVWLVLGILVGWIFGSIAKFGNGEIDGVKHGR